MVPSVVMEAWLRPLLSPGEFSVLVFVEETLIVLAVTMTNSGSISSTFRNVGEESTKGKSEACPRSSWCSCHGNYAAAL